MAHGRRVLRWALAALVIALAGAVLAVVVGPLEARLTSLWAGDQEALRAILEGRGKLVTVGAASVPGDLEGARFVDAKEIPELAPALDASDPQRVADALDAADVGGVLIAPARAAGPERPSSSATVRRRLERYDYVPGMRGVYLSPAVALYEHHRPLAMKPHLAEALVRVARGILKGMQRPRVSSFPEPLRRIEEVEVMVMLREAGAPRLWRSARGSSVARALLTASVVARERWQERQTAMQGSIDERLSDLTVEVSLLREDGTLASTRAGFLDRAVNGIHAVGYERKGSWRYLLPHQLAGVSSGAEAFSALLRENGLEPEAMSRPDVRLYRFVVDVLARSSTGGAIAVGSRVAEGPPAESEPEGDSGADAAEASPSRP
jgi:hypothetical protein